MFTVHPSFSLRDLNTFHLDAQAQYFVRLQHLQDLEDLLESEVYKDNVSLILGGGSNVVFVGNYEGLVIQSAMKGIELVEESDEEVLVRAAAGESWDDLVAYCVVRNWGGLENLSLIPGTVGAAPIQNIGAYGMEVGECIEWVEGIDLRDGSYHSFTGRECEFGYRDSIFKRRWKNIFFISSVTLRLRKKNHQIRVAYGAIQQTLQAMNCTTPGIDNIRAAVISIRKEKLPDPAITGNAGSFFKNPVVTSSLFAELQEQYPHIPHFILDNQLVKVPAAWLIEQCGWKGKISGRVGVHPQQALVLINCGGATGSEIISLAENIQTSVREKFGIALMMEVNVISSQRDVQL
ncbi:MAG: UDP-N-acetylmuramate dehydrogenase [Cyclobacteriaceae bacterium]|nr:UDP-N-acetylmuramate dehydrogenase [Cyclobacteriaceae bacterium]